MIPQWLEMALGVNRALGILLKRADLEFGPILRRKGPGFLPLSLFGPPREFGQHNETRSGGYLGRG